MRFANAQWLWLLPALVPLLMVFLWWAWRTRQRLAAQFVHSRLLPNLVAGFSATRRKIGLGLIVLATIFLILTLAQPQWGFTEEEVKQHGLDIVVAIDTSRSMLAEDVKPNRLTKAKFAALDLMQQARADRLGLVAFAGSAFLQCPLTLDDEAFRQSVNALDVNIIPQGGTALAEAIETSLGAFKAEGENHKVLVLLTDGEDHDGAAVEAAIKAAKAGMKIFTVGIGTADGELLRLHDENGKLDYLKDDEGNVVKSRLNEDLLQQIAHATEGGFYLHLGGAKTIDTLYERGLAPLPKSELTTKRIRSYNDRFQWPLATAILLLLAEMFFPERKRAKRPVAGPVAPAKNGVQSTVALGILLLPLVAWGSPSSAKRQYEAGKYDDALKEYQQLLKRNAADPRLHFNAGAAAYQKKQFGDAAKEFNEALSARDLQLQQRGYYNMGNTLYQLGEQSPDPAKKSEDWENSVKSFDNALKLNPQDADARFNYEFVKNKLEKLKQQLQQSSKNQSKDQKQSQEEQQKEQAKNDSKQDESKQSPSEQKQDSSPSKQDSQAQKDQGEKSGEQKQADSQSQEKHEQPNIQKQSSQDQASAQPKDKSSEQTGEGPANAAADGRMTPQQAQQLLEAQKGDEKIMPVKIVKRANSGRIIKNW